MRKLKSIALVTSLGLSLAIVPPFQVKAETVKPSAPTITSISSSTAKKGNVNVTVTIALPTSVGGSKITGSKVTAGGKSCTISKTKTSCTIKSIKNGKTLIVVAASKNINGFGSASKKITYVAGSVVYRGVTAVAVTPMASSPMASSLTTISVAAIAGVTAPVTGATPVTTTTAGTGYTGTVAWSGSPATFASATTYIATITLTPTSGYTLAGVTANFFTVAGATSVTNSANQGVITAVFPASYAVGDTGPGGGIIYYVDSAGFSCGASYTTTGSPTGGLCKYLEVAPSQSYRSWANGTSTSGLAHQDVAGITNESSANNSSTGIGLGYKNSVAIVNQGNDTTTAAGVARAYAGGSKNDWYLPTTAELNLLCQWNRNVTQNVITICAGGNINGGTNASGSGFVTDFYWSSSEYNATDAFAQDFRGPAGQGVDVKYSGNYVRPVRAF